MSFTWLQNMPFCDMGVREMFQAPHIGTRRRNERQRRIPTVHDSNSGGRTNVSHGNDKELCQLWAPYPTCRHTNLRGPRANKINRCNNSTIITVVKHTRRISHHQRCDAPKAGWFGGWWQLRHTETGASNLISAGGLSGHPRHSQQSRATSKLMRLKRSGRRRFESRRIGHGRKPGRDACAGTMGKENSPKLSLPKSI